ncbi:uncharacterized protein ACIBXB_008805 isoform 2-T2 [Morphnus guianensis]
MAPICSKITHQQEANATYSHHLCIVIQIQSGSKTSQLHCSELIYSEDLTLSKGATGPMHFINSVMKCSHLAHSTLPSREREGEPEPRMQNKSSIFLGMILQAL